MVLWNLITINNIKYLRFINRLFRETIENAYGNKNSNSISQELLFFKIKERKAKLVFHNYSTTLGLILIQPFIKAPLNGKSFFFP